MTEGVRVSKQAENREPEHDVETKIWTEASDTQQPRAATPNHPAPPPHQPSAVLSRSGVINI